MKGDLLERIRRLRNALTELTIELQVLSSRAVEIREKLHTVELMCEVKERELE